jgi:hypothetical protein
MKALLVAILLAVVSIPGYMIYRDQEAATAAEEVRRELFIEDQRAQTAALEAQSRDLKLQRYESEFGAVALLELKAFTSGWHIGGLEAACGIYKHRAPLTPAACKTMERNRAILESPDDPREFSKPPR